MEQWLTIIGIGEEGLSGLGEQARAAIAQASLVVGGVRHLAMIGDNGFQEKRCWPSPFSLGIEMVMGFKGSPVCVLASGDPMHYGVGATLARLVPASEMRVISAPSAYALAAARLGWALQDCVALSVHGRPLELVIPHLHPQARLLILADSRHTPASLCQLLDQRGFGASRVVVLEHMGGPKERICEASAQDWPHQEGADLNIIAVECAPVRGLTCLSGLPDSAYEHDGQLTKRDVRAVTLARLAPEPGQLLWDVGAGCGSIGIEWMRSHPRCQAIAIEANLHRQKLIEHNRLSLGVPGLKLVGGQAPEALTGLPAPDAIFIGGGLTGVDVVNTCWDALKQGGRLVANAVSIESQNLLVSLQKSHGGTLTQITVAHQEALGRFTKWQPTLTVTVWEVWKV